MAEWFKAPVLKTGRGLRSLVGSNPTPSATLSTLLREGAPEHCASRGHLFPPLSLGGQCVTASAVNPRRRVAGGYFGERAIASLPRTEKSAVSSLGDVMERDDVRALNTSRSGCIRGVGLDVFSRQAAAFRSSAGRSQTGPIAIAQCSRAIPSLMPVR